MTNFEKIKQMTVEEFAVFLSDVIGCCIWQDCDVCVFNEIADCCYKPNLKNWLNKETEERTQKNKD